MTAVATNQANLLEHLYKACRGLSISDEELQL